MKKALLIVLLVMCMFSCFSVCVYAEPAAGEGTSQTEAQSIAANEANEVNKDKEQAVDQKNKVERAERKKSEKATEAATVKSDKETEQTTAAQEAEESTEGAGSLLTLNDIILYAALLLILILCVANIILTVSGLKKLNDNYESLEDYIDEDIVNNLPDTRDFASKDDIAYARKEIQSVHKAVQDINTKLGKINNGKPAESKKAADSNISSNIRSRASKYINAQKDNCSLYNDYLSGKSNSSVPRDFEIIKISLSGINPMLNPNDGIKFYSEKVGSEYNIYPLKEQMNKSYVPMMGSGIIEFNDSGNGRKNVIKPAKVSINFIDGIISVKSKGKAEY